MNSKDFETVALMLEREAVNLLDESKDLRRGESPSNWATRMMKRTGTKRYGDAARKLRSMAKTMRSFK